MQCAIHAAVAARHPYSVPEAVMVVGGFSVCDVCAVSSIFWLMESRDRSILDVIEEAVERGFV